MINDDISIVIGAARMTISIRQMQIAEKTSESIAGKNAPPEKINGHQKIENTYAVTALSAASPLSFSMLHLHINIPNII